jgi:hypothetical protein
MLDQLPPLADFLPILPLHWTSINHYLLIIMVLAILLTSGEEVSMFFLISVGLVAVLAGASLYLNFFPFSRLFVFLIKTALIGMPLTLVGTSPSEQSRGLSVVTSLLAAPIFLMAFFNCILPGGWQDPRIPWC